MVQEDLLLLVASKLRELKIPYMLTGGVAVIFYGKPRLTHDFDLVVEMPFSRMADFVEAFRNDFYISREAIQEALSKRTMFNLIHLDSGIKVDFWMLQDNEFDRMRFHRRQAHQYGRSEVVFSSPEDMILQKLLWFKESDVQKHADDARSILQIQPNLDKSYLQRWAAKLSVLSVLNELS
jgi:hypothetical protein